MLIDQGKVQNPSLEKINNCKLLSFTFLNEEKVVIGAIKHAKEKPFCNACLPDMFGDFELELGYLFTKVKFRNLGISSVMVKEIITLVKDKNIYATTELETANPMMYILKKNGFDQYGSPFKSGIHGKYLGLFLRFA
jgi:hypothetical protein